MVDNYSSESHKHLDVQLAVLVTKLDAIQTTLNARLDTIEKRIIQVDDDTREQIRTDRAHAQQQVAALQEVIAAKVDRSEFEPIRKVFWATIMGALSSIGLAIWTIITKGPPI